MLFPFVSANLLVRLLMVRSGIAGIVSPFPSCVSSSYGQITSILPSEENHSCGLRTLLPWPAKKMIIESPRWMFAFCNRCAWILSRIFWRVAVSLCRKSTLVLGTLKSLMSRSSMSCASFTAPARFGISSDKYWQVNQRDVVFLKKLERTSSTPMIKANILLDVSIVQV